MANWFPSEELQLCVSWVRQSTCPITGRYQSKNNLWRKVFEDYVHNWSSSPGEPQAIDRTKVGMESRFPRLKKCLLKWHSCKKKASDRVASGTNLVDEMTQAQSLYFMATKKEFDKFACYEAIKNHPHFVSVDITPSLSQFDRNFPSSPELHGTDSHVDLDDDDEGFTTPPSNQETPLRSSPVRPIGIKAAKEAKKKGKKGMAEKAEKSLAIFHTMQRNQHTLMEANMRRDEETLKLSRESLELEKRKEARIARREAMESLLEETKIMTMDTSMMTPNTKKWYKRRKSEIMGQVNESTSTSEGCYIPHFDDEN